MAVLWTLLLNGGLGLAAYLAARFALRQPPGAPRGLATAVLAWSWLSIGMEILGPLGHLARGPLLGWVCLGIAIATGFALDRRGESSLLTSPPDPWTWTECLVVGIWTWAALMRALPSLLLPVKVVSDGPIYHLYFAARWWKSHRLELIAAPFGANVVTYFPAAGDLWFSWLMIGWDGDRLAKIGQGPFYVLAAFASIALARRLGAGRAAAITATAWCLLSAPLLLFTFEGNVDTIFLVGYILAAYFFTRHALGDDGLASLLLGGLAAGCTMATKTHGIVFTPPLLAYAAWGVLRRREGLRTTLAGLLVAALSPLAVVGFWYGQNAWSTGNPLYPLHIVVGGRVILAGWYGTEVMKLSHYYLPASDWRAFVDILTGVIDPRLTPVWVAALAGAWAFGRRREGGVDRCVWIMSALVVLNIACYWLLVPYRTQQRFMFHAVALSAIPLARLLDRSRAWFVLGLVLLGVHVFTPQSWPSPADPPIWDLSRLIPHAAPALITLPERYDGIYTLVPLAVGLLAMIAAGSLGVVLTRRGWRTQLAAWLGVVASLATCVALSFPYGASPARLFFPIFPEYVQGWLELEQRSGPRGAKVAYAGNALPYYLMGVGLRNEVRYINVDAHRDWLLHDYHRAASLAEGRPATWDHPCPGWDRIHPDYDAWLANLRAEGVQILVVNRANPVEGPHNIADRDGFPVERQWAEGHPESFEPLYGVAERDPQFRLYRVRAGVGAEPSGTNPRRSTSPRTPGASSGSDITS